MEFNRLRPAVSAVLWMSDREQWTNTSHHTGVVVVWWEIKKSLSSVKVCCRGSSVDSFFFFLAWFWGRTCPFYWYHRCSWMLRFRSVQDGGEERRERFDSWITEKKLKNKSISGKPHVTFHFNCTINSFKRPNVSRTTSTGACLWEEGGGGHLAGLPRARIQDQSHNVRVGVFVTRTLESISSLWSVTQRLLSADADGWKIREGEYHFVQ